MGKVKRIRIEELYGYRMPSAEEKRQIYNYLQKELLTRRKQMKLFRTVFACFAIAMTSGNILNISEKSLNAELVIGIIITIALWCAFAAVHKNLVKNRILEIRVKNGEYKVLDCLSYEHHYAQDPTRTEGSVQIQTRDGVPCMGNFVIDIETALLSEKGKVFPLLLMYDKETGESRVFSEKMLNQR